MKKSFYTILIRTTRYLGPWWFYLIAGWIATGYFLFRPHQAKVSMRFYAALFPKKKPLFHAWCAWRQYLSFTTVYLDRIAFQPDKTIDITENGWEHLTACLSRKTGAIILMSHIGNWELAAHLMKQKDKKIDLLLYMGRRAKEQIESQQKKDLDESGVRIIAVDEAGGSPFDILEGIRFLQSGGVVSMTGDRLWYPGQRFVEATFLNHRIQLPETPHLMAMLSKAPLLIFFPHRTGRDSYHLTLSPPLRVPTAPRGKRQAIIAQSAQNYADRLEAALHKNPYQWYHFEPFIEP